MYKILCEVSGGVTGDRCAYFKCRGAEVVFSTLREAQKQADQLIGATNNEFSTATFNYTVEKVQ